MSVNFLQNDSNEYSEASYMLAGARLNAKE